MKLIKRYTNRKLYDTERSCYVTLDEIAEMVRDGEDVRIVDNRSGEDLTTVTLAQIVYEEEKRDRKLLPLQSLRMIIQSQSEFIQRISRPVAEFRENTQQQVERLRERAVTQQEEIVTPIRDFVDGIQRTIDSLGNQLDDRLRDSVDGLTHGPTNAADIQELKARVGRLESDVAEMKRMVAELHESTAGRRRGIPTGKSGHTLPSSRRF